MKKPKYYPGAVTGKAFEDLFDKWCNQAKITFYKDETLSSGKRRRKDKKVDRQLIIDGESVFAELKSTTSKQALDYDVTGVKTWCKIKLHQIGRLDWLIINYYDVNETYAISRKAFHTFIADHKKNSISYKDVKEIGKLVEDMKWILTSKSNKPE